MLIIPIGGISLSNPEPGLSPSKKIANLKKKKKLLFFLFIGDFQSYLR